MDIPREIQQLLESDEVVHKITSNRQITAVHTGYEVRDRVGTLFVAIRHVDGAKVRNFVTSMLEKRLSDHRVILLFNPLRLGEYNKKALLKEPRTCFQQHPKGVRSELDRVGTI